MTVFSMHPIREMMGFVSLSYTFSIQLSNELSLCAHVISTLYRGSSRHWTYHGTILHTWQFKQVAPSYTKSHVLHSLRTLICFFDTRPCANRSSSFTVYNPYWIITLRDGNLMYLNYELPFYITLDKVKVENILPRPFSSWASQQNCQPWEGQCS